MEIRRRNSGLELLRIISMLMIISSHFAQHSGNGNWDIMLQPFSLNTIWCYLFGIYGQLGVCIFIVLSSWFLCDSDGIHIKKIFLINSECIFYTLIYFILIQKTGLENLNVRQFLKIFMTPWRDGYWFILSYFCFYMCVPALQYYSRNVSISFQKKFLLILTMLFFILGIMRKNEFGNVGSFFYIFLFCSYLKKRENNFIERNCIAIFISLFLTILFLCFAINIGFSKYNRISLILHIYTYRNIWIVMEAISLFYIFKKHFNIGYSKVINGLAGTTLGVYILHESWLFCLYVSEKSIHKGGLVFEYLLNGSSWFYNSNYFGLYYIGVVLGIFILCSIIEYLRILTFDNFIFGKMKKINSLFVRFDNWYKIA